MHTIRNLLFASAAIAGLAGLAMAAAPVVHEITIQMPQGGVEHIRYTGEVAPRVVFVRAPMMPAASFGFWGSPFADLDRISAVMDEQMQAMLTQAQAMQQIALSGGMDEAVLKGAPAGTLSYSFVAMSNGQGFCSRSVQITPSADGGKPKVISHTSGDCGSQEGIAAPSASPEQPGSLQTISLKSTKVPAAPRHGI